VDYFLWERERADDVPEKVSKNDFVTTVDTVRAADGGGANKRAKNVRINE